MTDLKNPTLKQLLGHLPPAERDAITVAAIHCPLFHRTPVMEAWSGFGWTEWDLVKKAIPRFPGHRQPILPQWGCYDESDPAWATKEIDAAADHGIDAWMVDWYWYSGVEILNETLDQGFLHAPNRNRLKFGLMWANHSWRDMFPAPRTGPIQSILPIRHNLEDLDRVMDVWCERYFPQPNYWRIDGRPWCSFLLLKELLAHLGGEVGVGRALEHFRKRAETNGESGLHLGCFTEGLAQGQQAINLGFDHVTQYNITHITHPQFFPQYQPVYDYEQMMIGHAKAWLEMAEAAVPFWTTVTQGWDVSSRNHVHEPWPPQRWEWPWGSIVQGNTPQRFGELCAAARRVLSGASEQNKVMLINAWNEWPEGSVLAPTVDQGDAVLDALAAALK